MSENQSQPFYNLSKKDRKALKRQLEQEAKKADARNSIVKRVVIISLCLAVIGFIVWWGVTKVNQQAAIQATSNIGGEAPNFSLPATTGETITLSEFKGKKNVLIYFHEGLSCDPCIQQMAELENALNEFDKMNVEVLHVTYDPVDDLKKTAKQYQLKKPILSYNTASTENDYNLLPFSMGMARRAGHTFVLVDMNGKIIWRKDYWPGRGHMVAGGTMFVEAKEIVGEVKNALSK